ncbi:MAG: efflux RND transporter periplasmic adaptor subunit [Planctomycetota bacterium]
MTLTLESSPRERIRPSPEVKQRRQDSAARQAAQQMAAFLELLSCLDSCQDIKAFAESSSELLHRVIQEQNSSISASCNLTFVALENGSIREIGCSEPKWAANIEDWNQEIQSVVWEASATGSSTFWCEGRDEEVALLCHRQLATAWNARRVNCVLCRDRQGELQAAMILVLHESNVPLSEATQKRAIDNATRFLELASSSLASRVPQLIRLSQSVPQLVCSRAQQFVASRTTKFWLLAATLLFAIGLVPAPYRMAVECEVQPAIRKIITAPFDGRLKQMPIEEGAEVQADQVLVAFDGREIELELEQAEANLHQQEKTRDGLMAAHDIGKMRMAELEIQSLQSRLEALRYRQEKLSVKSPVSGVVLSSPYEQCDGQPVDKGEALFEVAPLDKLLFELAIPQNEIKRLREGQHCSIQLNAFPGRKWEGKIQTIHPQAEWKNEEYVFVAEVRLNSNGITPRPGMVGNATVTCESAPMLWNYIERPWNQLRYWGGF